MAKINPNRPIPTLERLNELFRYDENTGHLIRKIPQKNALAGAIAGGQIAANTYRYFGVDKRIYLAHRIVWYMHYGVYPDHEIDHINRNKDDNRISNLRAADSSFNKCNISAGKNNTSGFRGVSLHKKTGLWQAHIMLHGKQRHLGFFKMMEGAIASYKAAAKELHGEFSYLAAKQWKKPCVLEIS